LGDPTKQLNTINYSIRVAGIQSPLDVLQRAYVRSSYPFDLMRGGLELPSNLREALDELESRELREKRMRQASSGDEAFMG